MPKPILLICTGCGGKLPESEFNKDRKTKSGRRARCRSCTQGSDRQYLHSLDDETFLAMLEAQYYLCAICEVKIGPEGESPQVDHDHSCCPGRNGCGRCIRGLLCSNCNRALGMFGDDPEILERAAEYLNERYDQVHG